MTGREATVAVPRTLLEDIARRLYTAGDDLYREQVEKLLDAEAQERLIQTFAGREATHHEECLSQRGGTFCDCRGIVHPVEPGREATPCPDRDCTGVIHDDGSCTSGYCESGRERASCSVWYCLREGIATRGGPGWLCRKHADDYDESGWGCWDPATNTRKAEA